LYLFYFFCPNRNLGPKLYFYGQSNKKCIYLVI
jgi:hypothetical protein